MGSQLLLLLVIQCLLFLISFVSLSTSALCQNDQQLALLHFKQSVTIDPIDYCVQISTFQESNEGVQNSYPKTISWNSSIDCCLWDGVTCDESTGQVVELDLSCSQLLGTIDSNSTLFHLSHLQKLNLAGNRFDGSFISHKFGDFSYLTHLNLSSSRLSGQIPSNILHLPNLISLDLGDTYSYYSLLEIGNHDFLFLLQNATQLRELVLDGIPIHSSIPPNVSSSITTLSLSHTELQGSLPSNIFHLPNLQKLFLRGNKNLSIHFPSTRWNSSLSLSYLDLSSTGCPPSIIESLRNLSRVKYLGLANCGLSGKVSEAILDIEQLTALDLSDNSLEGGFPDLFIKLWRLKRLFLYSNSFTAQFPSSIPNITQLEALQLSNNSLYGTVPSWLFNHSTLYLLDLRYNQLQGPIPTSLSKQKNLIFLDLKFNNFSGTVELNMFSNLKRIVVLRLSNNRLSLVSNPKINSTSWLENLIYLGLSSCNLTNLNFLRDSKFIDFLDLSNNKIQGRIPEWAWSNWQHTLRYLNLSHNYLTSVEGIQLHSIDTIDLQFNLLEGPLPIPSSPFLRYYSASQNKLSGEVPFTVCNLRNVQVLDLANNNLSGELPSTVCNLRNVQVLDLANNNLSGVQNSYPKTISWNSSIDCCLWDGVTCDESTGQVVELDLSCSRLIGTIDSNSTLFHLSHLQKLNLAGNQFDGSFISHKFGDFSYLTHLNISSSGLSGQIPSKILHLPNLISLDLGDSFYSSSLFEIGNHDFMFLLQNATQLRELVLDGIPIHSSIPPNVSSSITTLSLSYTKLQGSLPTNIFHLPNLQKLLLQGNENLSIHFPSTRWNSSLSLSYLDLSYTGCPPNIIESLRNLSRVKYLGLANCGLSGKVSEAILDLEQLTTLDLSDNSLEGGFPDLFIKLWRLKRLFLYSNSFTAQFPSSITNITQLEALQLSDNSLYGTVPSWLFNHSTLYLLDLRYNQLQGPIPTSLSKQKNLILLDLSSNNLSGTVELNMFSNLKRIIVLRLSNNRLSLVSNSKINSTSWLENLISLGLSSCNLTNLNFLRDSKSLGYLDLSNNKIQGRIPQWAWSNWQDSLWHLNLSHNYLTSVEGIQLHSIDIIDLEFNLLEGPLPIPSSPFLRYYFASQNKLSDPIDYCVQISTFQESNEGVQNSYPKTISWNSSIDCCLWDGVTCDESTGQVVELDLSCSRLIGTIDSNSTLFHLSHLQKLNLAGNRFGGSFISHKFGDFSYLTHLNLSSSRLSGQIPSKILHLPNLISLDLGDSLHSYSLFEIRNHDFMFLLQNATQLRELVLDGIPIHSSIPPNVSSSITTSSLSYTKLQGSLPTNIFHLPNLQKLLLQGNENLSIHFPSTRWNSSLSLSYLDLGNTGCPPNIIESLRNLSRVKYLGLANCGLSGKVSEAILDLEQLAALDLSDNSLEGGFPDLFIKLWRLKRLFLYSNSFTAQFSSSITNITQLEALQLSNNSLYGTVPSWLFNHSTLYFLDLSSNQLQGSIPTLLSKQKNLIYLDLSFNQLQGSIPTSLSKQKNLIYLDLSFNQLQGSIPTSLSKQKNLIYLDLSSNNFSGTVELNMFSNLKRIMLLDLSNNRLSVVSNPKINSTRWLENLIYLSLSSCNVMNLNFLRDSKSLEVLDLSNNKIQGRIPEWAWSNWQDTLSYLNLSHNYLTSVEGIQLHSIDLVDLQFNLLEGPLPIPSSPFLRYYFASQNKLSGL
nr:receptor-like protein 12 [Ipomoea batatas]